MFNLLRKGAPTPSLAAVLCFAGCVVALSVAKAIYSREMKRAFGRELSVICSGPESLAVSKIVYANRELLDFRGACKKLCTVRVPAPEAS